MSDPLETTQLSRLTGRLSGRPEIGVGLIDGPVLLSHPDLATENIRAATANHPVSCRRSESSACLHGTFMAGALSARRGSDAPAICPGCTLVVRPIFGDDGAPNGGPPRSTPEDLAEAIVECVHAGAHVINLSSTVAEPSFAGARHLRQALDYACSRGVITVAAAGNQGIIGNTVITGHAGVVPVAACDHRGWPLSTSNLGRSIGRRGLLAPGVGIRSLGATGSSQTLSGTSAATPFVTGTMALLWSEFPAACASQIALAVTQMPSRRRRTIAPPLLNAWAAYQAMSRSLVIKASRE